MQENIIERLRRKEEEMEALVAGARDRAASIREDAAGKADEIRKGAAAALDAEMERLGVLSGPGIEKEVSEIEEAAALEAGRIRDAGRRRRQAAVEEAMRAVTEGIGRGGDDKGDGKGPHNRAKDPS